jgi:hypothetical protein
MFKLTLLLFFLTGNSLFCQTGFEATLSTSEAASSEGGRLDETASRYVRKILEARTKQKNHPFSGPGVVETFETASGPIFIRSNDITFGVMRSKRAAWIRIGKNLSRENVEAIKLFLKNSKQEKIKAGFKVIEERESPSDYGRKIISKLSKGDQYFNTYFQTMRTLESYERHSFAYTYYIEMGLFSRKKTWEKEQAEDKLAL